MLDVLMKNELQASDMLDIMHTILGYLGNCKKKVPSGGWSTHLWAAGNQCHMMATLLKSDLSWWSACQSTLYIRVCMLLVYTYMHTHVQILHPKMQL